MKNKKKTEEEDGFNGLVKKTELRKKKQFQEAKKMTLSEHRWQYHLYSRNSSVFIGKRIMLENKIKDIASRLKHARMIEVGWTLEEAAAKLGINKSTISRYETGKQIPDVKYLFIFEDITDISASWLLTGDKDLSLDVKDCNYLILADAVTTILARTLTNRKMILKWEYYGKVVKMLLQLSLELVHNGGVNLNIDDDELVLDDLSHKLQSTIDGLFYLITDNIFVEQ